MLLALSLACHGPRGDLASPDADARRRALVWLDRDEARARLPEVARIAEEDPDPTVRAEALLALGWSQDPRAAEVLRRAEASDPEAAARGWVADGRPEACARARAIPLSPHSRTRLWVFRSPCHDPP